MLEVRRVDQHYLSMVAQHHCHAMRLGLLMMILGATWRMCVCVWRVQRGGRAVELDLRGC